MTHLRVSIVTPSLNRRRFLERAIRSVAEQGYPNVEHIVVDGGSTDGTLELLGDAAERYGVRWISEADDGMYQAINKGLAMATGDVLAYLNTDDLYFPWSVEIAASSLAEHPDVDAIYGDLAHLDTETGRGGLRLYPPFRRGYLVRSAFIGQPTVFWRRRILLQMGGFDERLRYVADCDYWMRAGRQFRFLKLDEVMAIDGVHAETLRTTHAAAVFAELRSVRVRNGAAQGRRGLALRVLDLMYYALHTQAAFARLMVEWARHRVFSRRPRRWCRFLESDARISGFRLLLCLIPDRRRRLGHGVVTWQPSAARRARVSS